MSAVRTFMSITTVLFAVAGLAGCYDLSDPSGPRREDFMQNPPAAATDQQSQEPVEVADEARCTPAPCALDNTVHVVQTADADHGNADDQAQRKVRALPDSR